MFTSTSVSKTEIKNIYAKLGLEVPTTLKANYSTLDASNLILSTIESIVLPSTIINSLSSVVEDFRTTIVKSGNYSKENITILLQRAWEKVSTSYEITSIYRIAVKEWIKSMYKYIQTSDFHKLKEISTEANILAILALQPLM